MNECDKVILKNNMEQPMKFETSHEDTEEPSLKMTLFDN